jgi:hypothetical protein
VRVLGAGTTEVDVVVEDRWSLWWFLFIPVFWALRVHFHPRLNIATQAWLAGGAAVALLVSHLWLRERVIVGPSGVAYGQRWSMRHLAWSEIEGFALGNPSIPFNAYIVLKRPPNHLLDDRTRMLPLLRGCSPAELVALLNRKRRIFQDDVGRTSGTNAGSDKRAG